MSESIAYIDLESGSELQQLNELIENHESFMINKISDMSKAIEIVENAIESKNYSCRICQSKRVLLSLITISPQNLIFIAGHNLATFNPDFEVIKCLSGKKLAIKYCK